ncbi:MAG: glycoside hydrolase family 3 C-terminal domain-containing protein [Bacteroides sp.]|nr:glycoside hydrolase family 3 C-terminal domain-containing protein [Bacteroides sp.]
MNNYDYLDTLLPLKKRIKSLVSLLTAEEKIGLIPTRQAAVPRLNIKAYSVGTEIARGYVSHDENEPATVFPQPTGMASMFDTELMEKIGEVAGNELRYYEHNTNRDHLILFGPTVDLARDPRWGRNEECYGEDPFLAGQTVKAYTKGIVGSDPACYRAAPSLKHFYANNNEKDRVSSNSNIEPRTKHEYYYRAFRPAIEAGYALGVMTSYNSVNGLPAMINPDINKICKKQWGMKYALTDGGDVSQTVNEHRFTENHAETLALAIKNGTDIMCEDAELITKSLSCALKSGILKEKELDKAVYNALYPRFLLGEFDPPENNPYLNIPESSVNCLKSRALNLQAAREAVTLLKNNGLLPLRKEKIKRLALLGAHANETFRDWYTGTASYSVTVLEAFKALLPDTEIIYNDCRDVISVKSLATGMYLRVNDDETVTADGAVNDEACHFIKEDWGGEIVLKSVKNGKYVCSDGVYKANCTSLFAWFVMPVLKPYIINGAVAYKSWNDKSVTVNEKGFLTCETVSRTRSEQLFAEEIISDGIAAASSIAKKCDFAVVFAGNNPMIAARECYDRESIELPYFQSELTKTAYNANPNTVLCIISSYPYALGELAKAIPSIIYTAHGGSEMGNAVAETVLGINNPAGRTPMTWYGSTNELPSINDYDIIKTRSTYLYYGGQPLYPFGHGLSYSEFEYGDLRVADSTDTIEVSLTVRNVSDIGGDEVIQIYLSEQAPRFTRPLKQLCGFKRKRIEAGEKAEFHFSVNKREFARWDVEKEDYSFDEGIYRIYAGRSSEDKAVEAELFLSGNKIMPRNLRKKTLAVNYDDKNDVSVKTAIGSLKEYVSGTALFGGELVFFDCGFDNCKSIKIKASNDGNRTKISFEADGEALGEVELKPFVFPEDFQSYEIPLKKEIKGVHNLKVRLSEHANLYSIRLK